MKFNFLLVFLISLLPAVFGQVGIQVEKKEPCYTRAEKALKQKYGSWECGQPPGVVDCNRELSFDEEAGIVRKKATDNMNLTGDGKPFTGMCEMCHPNGIIQRKVSFVEGRENGKDTSYYNSGCPQVIREHIQGAESGTWTYYYDTTEMVAWEMNYILGQKHGRQIYFKANGDTTKIENYQNGTLHGSRKTYYSGSRLHREANYVKGLLDGKFTSYNAEGVVVEDLNYKQGKKDGVCKYYYDDGKLLKTEKYSMDVKDGEFKMFYYQGFVQSLETYKKGKKEGKFEEYWHNQKPKRIAVYKKDVLIEEHLFDEEGNETYSFGAPSSSGKEDDALPGSKKKKKKK